MLQFPCNFTFRNYLDTVLHVVRHLTMQYCSEIHYEYIQLGSYLTFVCFHRYCVWTDTLTYLFWFVDMAKVERLLSTRLCITRSTEREITKLCCTLCKGWLLGSLEVSQPQRSCIYTGTNTHSVGNFHVVFKQVASIYCHII